MVGKRGVIYFFLLVCLIYFQFVAGEERNEQQQWQDKTVRDEEDHGTDHGTDEDGTDHDEEGGHHDEEEEGHHGVHDEEEGGHHDEEGGHHEEEGGHHDEEGGHHDEEGGHHDEEEGGHHDEEGGHHDEEEEGGHHDEEGGHHDEEEGHHHEEGGHHGEEEGHNHGGGHAHGGVNFTINGEVVSSPGIYEIMERYDEDLDDYLSMEEFDNLYDDIMERAGGEGGEGGGHAGHGHKRGGEREAVVGMLERLSKRRVVMVRGEGHGHEGEEGECKSADELFEEFDLDEDNFLNSVEVLLLCPEILLQILDGCAAHDEHDNDCKDVSSGDAWLYGMMSTLGISLLSVVGVILIPIHNKKVKEYLINALIAFAVGALFGDVILHIIPHALGIHAHGEILDDVGGGRVYRELWLALTICAGFMLFVVLDLGIRALKHVYGVSDASSEKEMGDINDDVAAPKKSSSMVRKMTGFDEEKIKYRDIKTVGYLNLVSDGLHNFIDGITLGVAWTTSIDLGISTTIAIVAHEIPQELGDFGILVHAGFTKWQAILWNLCSASLAMLGAVVGLAVATSAEKAIPWLLAVAAGNFLYISLVSMMPEALKGIHDIYSGIAAVFLIALGIAILFVIAVFEETDCN